MSESFIYKGPAKARARDLAIEAAAHALIRLIEPQISATDRAEVVQNDQVEARLCRQKAMNTPKTPTAEPLAPLTGSAILCESCGYSGAIGTYLPSMSPTADCRCPKCGSTNNEHNADYADHLRRAWNCKHVGTLVEGGKSANGHPLLKCTDCGCLGLDWSMRGECAPSPNETSPSAPK